MQRTPSVDHQVHRAPLRAILAHEASLRERPIKILLPKDARFCWTNVLARYSTHPLLKVLHLDPDDGDAEVPPGRPLPPGDLVVGVFTFAATVSGRTTPDAWFRKTVPRAVPERGRHDGRVRGAAFAGLCVARDCLDLRADADAAAFAAILDGAMGTVQSGFDLGLSSMLFLDDAGLESCSAADDDGLPVVRERGRPRAHQARPDHEHPGVAD